MKTITVCMSVTCQVYDCSVYTGVSPLQYKLTAAMRGLYKQNWTAGFSCAFVSDMTISLTSHLVQDPGNSSWATLTRHGHLKLVLLSDTHQSPVKVNPTPYFLKHVQHLQQSKPSSAAARAPGYDLKLLQNKNTPVPCARTFRKQLRTNVKLNADKTA